MKPTIPPRQSDPSEDDPLLPEELVPEDDRIIGQAFRWSLLGIGIGALLVSAWILLSDKPDAREVVRTIDTPAPAELVSRTGLPSFDFREVSEQAGIRFRHANGAEGEKLLPETMGSGAAFFDYDSDGDPDLLLVNATSWPYSNRKPSRGLALYANDGRGSFRDVSQESGLDVAFYGVGVAIGDYDADSDPDVFITALGPNRLFQNRRGRFVEVTGQAGVAGDPEAWSSSAGFLDYDNDGDLDLFVCNYVEWSRQIDLDLNFTLNGRDRAYGPPNNFVGTYPYLYRNNGDGSFSDVSRQAGIQVDNPATGQPMAKALALLPIDLDTDGNIDILVANDTVQNFLYHNQGDGTFEEIGAFSGVGFDHHGKATGAMGIDAAYYRNGEELAVGIANFSNETTSLMVSQGSALLFSDEASGEGIGSPSLLKLSFGVLFVDLDLDGRLDFLQANGHLEEEINQVQASQHYRQSAQLFWNTGSETESTFALVPEKQIGDLARPIVARAATAADIDADGDVDLLLTQVAGPPLLLENRQQTRNHWLRVKLQGRGGNRDAIGAWVELTSGGVVQHRQLMPTRSYLSQTELPVTFGLGQNAVVDKLKVQWPDGSLQQVPVDEVDRTIVVRQENAG